MNDQALAQSSRRLGRTRRRGQGGYRVFSWLAIALLPWFAWNAFAAEPVPGPRGEYVLNRDGARVGAELLVDATSVAAGDRVRVGVLFDLDPGWHLYWRNPGDAGAAPVLDWRSADAETGPIQWPAPRAFREAEGLLTTFGYLGEVLLASEARLSQDAEGTWRIEAETGFVACNIECIPGHIDLAREVPVTARLMPPPSAVRDRFDLAASRLPKSAATLGVAVAARSSEASVEAGGDVALVLEIVSCEKSESDSVTDCRPWTLDTSRADEAFIPWEQSDLALSALGLSHPPIAASESARGFSLVLNAHAYEDEPNLDGQRLRGLVPLARPGVQTHLEVDVPLSLGLASANSAAFEVVAALRTPLPGEGHEEETAAHADVEGASLAWALALGLLGGLILNLMPCVLPVLAIKIFGIADLARAERSHVVKHGLAYLAGILASMAVLAGVVVGLRAAGTAVGWGFQLQDPIFLAVLCTILVVFAMNLFGAFEITLQPSGPSLGPSNGPSKPARSFFEGTLAVVLATPCTAPFLGTAVGFAFASSGGVIFAVFASVGIGLAAPYVLVTLVPGWARFVPRPGAWMLRVRQALGFSLLATVVWLTWVAGRTIGVNGEALLLAHLIAIAFLFWIFGVVQAGARPVATKVVALVAIVLAAASITALPLAPAEGDTKAVSEPSAGGINWLVFDPRAVERERAAGRPVFVDFTADWCITCKVNENLVLSDEAVREELARWDFAAFKADWTRRDDTITKALAKWGRAGVPMYLVYPADPAKPPQLLPELLTLGTTLEALRAAGKAGGA